MKVNMNILRVKQIWKNFHQPQWILSKVKVKIVKRSLRLKDEIRTKMVHSSEISCLSHSFAETIVINTRWILQNWRMFMFIICPATTTSLTFLTAIMVLEILNNVWKNFLQKIPVKSSFCREYCVQYEIHHTKLKEVYVLKRKIYKNLSHVSNIYYGFGNIKQCWKALFVETSS